MATALQKAFALAQEAARLEVACDPKATEARNLAAVAEWKLSPADRTKLAAMLALTKGRAA